MDRSLVEPKLQTGFRLFCAMLTILLVSMASAAHAQNSLPYGDRGLRLAIVHEPESDSYFELRRMIGSHVLGSTERGLQFWQAETLASRLEYEGRGGRLAVIDTLAKHALIREKIIPVLAADSENPKVWNTNAWIGLRYWCKYHTLMWVTAETMENDAPQPWDVPYFKFGDKCGANADYMGVFYNERGAWQAVGYGKEWKHILIEYPRLRNENLAGREPEGG